jgi:hypothetical protein
MYCCCSGISNEEKDHLRKNLLLNIREENSQVCTKYMSRFSHMMDDGKIILCILMRVAFLKCCNVDSAAASGANFQDCPLGLPKRVVCISGTTITNYLAHELNFSLRLQWLFSSCHSGQIFFLYWQHNCSLLMSLLHIVCLWSCFEL